MRKFLMVSIVICLGAVAWAYSNRGPDQADRTHSACTMARYLLKQQLDRDWEGLGDAAEIDRCGRLTVVHEGPEFWTFAGNYRPPINSHLPIPFEIDVLYLGNDRWRATKIVIDGELAQGR